MSYTDDCMSALTIALKNTDNLKYAIRDFNNNIETFKRLVSAIERHNELMEMQLGLRPIDESPDSINLKVKRKK